ncbi:esterase [Melittangium boletus]|uniref:Cholesterol oxidase n=2 Tax=Melittangium TaxID=44 RepID=A0A250IS98_9BACT|nr:esterase [Melittangium boletus]ATB34138.1 cholesterol oxidase [Melittangium boletus DSM 14713]
MRTSSATYSRPREERIDFKAGDGRPLNLIRVRGARSPVKGPIVLVHGAGVRANIFRAPIPRTIVDTLVADGYDVWMENWRASIDLEPSEWTLDQAAVHDHPKAIEVIARKTGWKDIKAIVHCQGASSFVLSAVAGLIPRVKLIISNAVSLHPVMSLATRLKLRHYIPKLSRWTSYLDPQWGLGPEGLLPWLLTLKVRATHRECDNTVCRMVSDIYGVGHPTLWSHEHLNPATHEWLKYEFAKVPLTFFAQMVKSLRAGYLVPVEGYRELPSDVVTRRPQTDARFVFMAGRKNHCFLFESQRRTYEALSRYRKGYHSLHVLPEYGHLDIFMGKNAPWDVFPIIQAELNRPV